MHGHGRIARRLAGLLWAALVAGCGVGGASPGSSPPSSDAGATPSTTPAGTTLASPDTATATPLAPASASDVLAWHDAVATFTDRFNRLSQDAPAAFEAFTDDARILDPSNADFWIGPKSEIVWSWDGWMKGVDAYQATTTAIYVSSSAAVVPTDVAVAWPSGNPYATPPLVKEARIFRFLGAPAANVTTFELWYELEGMAKGKGTCFELRNCGPALRAFITRYVNAWNAGSDASAIAALYVKDATFIDGVLGIEATGPDAISALAASRFGWAAAPGCSVKGTYVVTNDGDPAVSDWDDPDGGKVAGVTLLTSCRAGPQGKRIESATVLMLGTWTPMGYKLDPDGRILREEVFHDAGSLVAAGLVR